MTARPTIPEPIEWRFWRNRFRREAVTVTLSTYENRNLVSVRIFTTSPEGKMLPTAKGVSLVIERLPELHAAVNSALRKAREMGLIPNDDGGGE
jgi:hypothetical protein